MTSEGFVEHLRTRLTEVAANVDRTRPENRELIINERGEPSLKRLQAKAAPQGLAQLEEALREKIPERHLLDVLARIDHVTDFTRHFGPPFRQRTQNRRCESQAVTHHLCLWHPFRPSPDGPSSERCSQRRSDCPS